MSGMLDPNTRTAKVRCTFDNPDRLLRPEMYATMQISVEQKKALAIPRDALLRLGEYKVVFVQVGEGRRPLRVRARSRSTSTRASRASGSRSGTASKRAEGRRERRHPALAEALTVSPGGPMIQRIVAAALRMPLMVLAAALLDRGRRARRLQGARHRGVPEPGAAARRDHHAAARVERRGDGAIRHGAARDRAVGHAGPRAHPVAEPLRPLAT